MADLQSKMNAHQQDIDRTKEQIHDTTQKADSYLTELTKRVEEYEQNHTEYEPASKYLKSALDASRSATQELKTRGQDLSERTVPVALDGMRSVRESLDDLQQQAVAYDNKYTGSRGQHAVDTLHHWVNAGRQHATDAMETTNDQLMKLRDTIGSVAGQATHGAQVAVGEAVRAAEFGDEKLGVSSKAGGVVEKVRALDERLGVTATAAKVDTKITGGLGCKVASTTVDMVTESVSYISETLHNAKIAAQQSETAQSVEAKGAAATGAVAAKKDEVQQTFNEAFEKGKEKAGMATEKTEEKAGEMKEMTAEKAGQVKEKAGEVKDQTAEKAGEMKDKTKEKAGEAAETAKDKTGMAKDKAGEAAETAKDKTGMAKDKAGEATEMVKDKTGMAKDKAGEATEMAKDKTGMAKDKAGEATEMAKDKTSMAKDKASKATGMAKEKAGEATEMAKDKAGMAKAGDTKEQSKGIVSQAMYKAKETLGSAADTARGMGTRTEAKTTKPKEPTTTQEETNTEKALEAAKQTRAKESEAAKTAAGTAHKEKHSKHAMPESTGGERDTPGFKQAQQHAAKSSK